MMRELAMGVAFGAGIWLILRGLFPDPETLAERLAGHAGSGVAVGVDDGTSTAWSRLAMWLLRRVRGDRLADTEADVLIIGGTLRSLAVDKLNSGLAGAFVILVVAFLMGWVNSVVVMLLVLAGGFAVSYLLPDMELRRKAATRREEFNEVLTGFVSLLAVSVAGGGGLNSALQDVTDIGESWVFDTIRQTLDESTLIGESPWTGLDRLGRRLQLPHVVELAGALSLAGMSGARLTETLESRARSGRSRELTEALARAERKSETMNVPVAALLLGWVGFVAYPAVVNLLGL